MTIYDFPEVEIGDYGICVCSGDAGEPPRLVYYDDDGLFCSDGIDEDDDDHECGCIGEDDEDWRDQSEDRASSASDATCFLEDMAITHPFEGQFGIVETIHHYRLHSVPARIEGRPDGVRSRIYAVALVPELDICRLKVGFTERPISQRLSSYRTANPNAVLLGLWDAPSSAEALAHSAVGGRRLRNSEVFVVDDLAQAIENIDAALRRFRP